MDRGKVKVCRIEDQDEAFCLSLSPDERIAVLEALNRRGRALAGFSAESRLDRKRSRRERELTD